LRLYLFAFGKLKTPGLREAADYYTRNLKPWAPLEEIELKGVKVTEKTPAVRAQVQAQESKLLEEKVAARVFARGAFYLLDETGKSMSTQDWAGLVRGWEAVSYTEVALCVGSGLGFSPELRKKARGVLSLGPQTLPHELARVVLLEQLYRAYSVVRGHPYHNEG
jgi:23S rRNA (pseudouridine1915-N3)-methyltransferase